LCFRAFPVFRCLHMDYVTRRFVGLSKQFVRLTKKLQKGLTSFHRDLEKYRESIDKQVKRQTENQQTQNRLLEPPFRVNAETRETEASQTQNRSRHNRNLGVQILLTVGTWGAFIAAAVYAGIASRQLDQAIQARRDTKTAIEVANRSAKAAEDALEESRDDSRKALRPYMGLNFGMAAPAGEVRTAGNVGNWLNYNGSYAEWSFHFKNFGKSPAINMRSNAKLEVGPDAWRRVEWHAISGVAGNSVAPEGDYWMTARSRSMSQSEYVVFHETFANIAVFGHIEYEGLDGSSYWMEYCFSHGNGGAIEMCPTHNLGN
jgi:hypothetical protein